MIHDLSHILNAPLPEAVRLLKQFAVPQPSRSAPARTSLRLARPRPCDSLGAKAIPDCACEDRICNAGKGVVKHRVECQQCGEYVAKEPTNDAERSRAMRGNASQPVAASLGGSRVDAHATLLGGLPGALGLAATHRGPAARIDALPPASRTLVNLPGHFNASVTDWQGRTLLASRAADGIHLSELGDDWQPKWTRYLPLHHARSANGAEDPRWYVHGGRLHVRFSGVQHVGNTTTVSILDARLADDLRVEHIWEPVYAARRYPKEKNWAPFEVDGDLLSVYNCGPPYVVLKHEGETARVYASFAWRPRFSGGVIRGGAAPVRVGGEFWHFFHGYRLDPRGNDYTLGLHTFSASPPFQPLRIVPTPLLHDHSLTRPRNENPAIYPCGAIRRGESWFVSYGLHDSYVEIVEYPHDALERLLVPV